MNKIKSVISAILLSLVSSSCFGLGSGAFGNQTGISAKATSHGFAFTGVADDASAIFYNPAGLTHVKGIQTMLGGAFVSVDSEHTSPTGQNDTLNSHTPFVPYFYTSYSGQESKWAFGLGVNSPFGLLTDWKEDSFSRYYATETRLLMYMINPTVAYAVRDNLSFGFGLDYANIYDTELNSMVKNDSPLFPGTPTGDAHSKLSGNGHAWGYNLGAHWKANEKHSFGLSYRSQINVPIKGDLEITELQDGAAFALGGATYKSDVSTEFTLPQTITVGYGFKPNDRWTIFADYEWADWKVVEETRFEFSNNNSNLTQSIARNWKSSNNIGLGAEMKATERIDLRFGALAYERVIPDGTLESTLPDSSRYAGMIGTGINFGQSRIDLGYQAIFFNDRSVDNNQGNINASMDGEYESMVNVFSLGFSHKWGGKS